MNANEFAYWLQGFFEINSNNAPLTKKQAAAILEKANSVKVGTGEAEFKAQKFVDYTKRVFSHLAEVEALNKGDASNASYISSALEFAAKVLKRDLNELFIHAIDPTVPGDQKVHRKAHRPNGNGGLEAMC